MKTPASRSFRNIRLPLTCAVAALGLPWLQVTARAATNDYFWSSLGAGDGGTASGGSGIWDAVSPLWRNNTTTGALGAYPTAGSTNIANFGGTAGTVTLGGNVAAASLLFTSSGYVINGDANNQFKITLNGFPQSIAPGNGNVATINAAITGTLGLNKQLPGGSSESGTLILGGANTYTGTTSINGGTIRVSSIGTTASASSNLGAGGMIKLGSFTNGGTLTYTGAGETTNRTFDLAGSGGGSGAISNLGLGTLTITSDITSSNSTSSAAGSNNLFLTGRITVTGDIRNNSATNKTVLNVQGAGPVTLSASTSFTGGVNIRNNGTLLLDYAGSPTALNSANSVAISTAGGALYLKAKSSGSTSQTLGGLSFQHAGTVVVDSNGGDGATLTVGALTRNAPGALVIDLSSANSAFVANTNGTSGSLVDNVLVGGTTSTSFAGFLVKTSAGYDFASAASAGAAQTIIPLGAGAGATVFTGSNGSANTVNGKIASPGVTTIGATAQTLGTLRVDTTGAAQGVLSVGAGGLNIAKSGLLFDGSGDYAISGSGALSSIGFYQFSTGAVTLSSAFGSARIDKFGPGLLINDASSQTLSGGLNLFGGVYRAAKASSLPTSAGNIAIGAGGVLELTAGSGDFTRSLGTGANQLQLLGDGGFSAFGGARVVAFGGLPSPSALTWGSGSFVPSGNRLALSSASSDSTVDFRNSLNLNGLVQEVSVANGSAAIDAIISGLLSSSIAGGGLKKTGAGALELSAANAYSGLTKVNEGTLLVSGSIAGSSSVQVEAGASLLLSNPGDHLGNSAALALAGGTFGFAAGAGALSEGSGFSIGIGALTLTADSILDLGAGAIGTLNFAGFAPAGFTLNILNYSRLALGDTSNPGADGSDDRLIFAQDQSANLSRFSFNGTPATQISYISGGNSFYEIVPVPEPGAASLMAAAAGVMALRRRRGSRSASK